MASQDDKYTFPITDGPSKFDLMVSLFEGCPSHRKFVTFELAGLAHLIPVAITCVEQKDGSGESWNIKGWARTDTVQAHVEGYYASRGRKGLLKFVVPTHNCWKDERRGFVSTVDAEGERKLAAQLSSLRS